MTIGGCGEEAGMYQDHYARSFEHALLGIWNEPVTVQFVSTETGPS